MTDSSISILHTTAGLRSRWTALPRWQTRCIQVLAGSALVAGCAHIAVPLPFTPVPFTLQPFAVLLVGMVLGPVAGFWAMMAYLLEGAAGMPVFTPGGAGGIARLLGPTGGYLLSYPLAAALAGTAGVFGRRFWTYTLGGTVAMLQVYLCGTAWFSHLLHVPFRVALSGAVLPFALADAVKVLVAAGMATSIHTALMQQADSQGSEQHI